MTSPGRSLDTTSISIEDIRPIIIEETERAVNSQSGEITNGICDSNKENDDVITDLKRNKDNVKKNNNDRKLYSWFY